MQSFVLPKSIHREKLITRVGAVLGGLSIDKAWSVTIDEYKPKRSDNQNRYLWGVVYPSILKAGGELLAGWEAEEIHEYLLGEKFGWEVIQGFGVKRRRPIRRSSRLSKLEFVEYTQFIQQKMAEHGIYVPDPNEMAA